MIFEGRIEDFYIDCLFYQKEGRLSDHIPIAGEALVDAQELLTCREYGK